MEQPETAPAQTLRPTHAAARVSVQVLFAVVALLLLADLHSSYWAGEAEWETNPFISALSEHIGSKWSLVAVKCADLACLLGLYALWLRSKANLPIAVVLLITATVYAQIVVNNYRG